MCRPSFLPWSNHCICRISLGIGLAFSIHWVFFLSFLRWAWVSVEGYIIRYHDQFDIGQQVVCQDSCYKIQSLIWLFHRFFIDKTSHTIPFVPSQDHDLPLAAHTKQSSAPGRVNQVLEYFCIGQDNDRTATLCFPAATAMPWLHRPPRISKISWLVWANSVQLYKHVPPLLVPSRYGLYTQSKYSYWAQRFRYSPTPSLVADAVVMLSIKKAIQR